MDSPGDTGKGKEEAMTFKLMPAAILVFCAAAAADPVDTAYELLEAIEYGDGYALENLLSEDLYAALNGFIDQVRVLIDTDPVLAEDLLRSRYGNALTIEIFEYATNEELLGMAMDRIPVQSYDMVENESAQLQGREAVVVISYFDGSSVSFRMTWENSDWRVTDSSLLVSLFD